MKKYVITEGQIDELVDKLNDLLDGNGVMGFDDNAIRWYWYRSADLDLTLEPLESNDGEG